MRPVEKFQVGHVLADESTILASYRPDYGISESALIENLGPFCSYCEVFSSDLEVEHIVSKNQARAQNEEGLIFSWLNFLIACGRCNGADNKGSQPIDFSKIYLPHIHNTLLALEYREGGVIVPNSDLEDAQKSRAEETIRILGLDKVESNSNKKPRDRRFFYRREAWENAVRQLTAFESGRKTESSIVRFAKQRGFFSVWFTVFKDHPTVKKALIDAFPGTAQNCFDPNFDPIPRNLGQVDPI